MPRTEELRRERDELDSKLRGLAGEQRRVLWGSIIGIAAIPVGLVWGGLAALAALGLTLGVVGVALYIINGHRFEYETRLRNVDDELKKPSHTGS
ncbi:MAG: hypothetical protein ACAI38_01475 [Myxococcota bacterium]|nr:hypothetical protein [Myxococcota bacterium]